MNRGRKSPEATETLFPATILGQALSTAEPQGAKLGDEESRAWWKVRRKGKETIGLFVSHSILGDALACGH